MQKEAVLAAERSLVTVERIVDALTPTPGGIVIPGWAIDLVARPTGPTSRSGSRGRRGAVAGADWAVTVAPAPFVAVHVFARGLLRHLMTRIYLHPPMIRGWRSCPPVGVRP